MLLEVCDGLPLHLAAFRGENGVMLALLQCGAAAESGWTPLHVAVNKGTFLGIIHLLEHGADIHACNKVGCTPAHLAALKGNTTILKVLVKAGCTA